MLNYDFEKSIGFWIVQAHQSYMRAFQQALAPHGITFRQAQVLGWLVARGPLSQRELAEKIIIEPPNLVGVLDRMERAGLIERRDCESDRRKKLIHILPSAEPLWQNIAKCGHELRRKASAGLSEEEMETFQSLLKRVQLNCEAPENVEV